jgi:hypothetical protein
MATTAWASFASATLTGDWSAYPSSRVLTQDGSNADWGNAGINVSATLLNPGFSDLPDDATITGFNVRCYARETNSGQVYAYQIYLRQAGADYGSNRGGTTAGFKIQSTFQWHSWAVTDGTVTPAQAKASTFGVRVGFDETGNQNSPSLEVDAFQIQAVYTPAASGNPNTVGITRRRR